jgi:hypothetical protein
MEFLLYLSPEVRDIFILIKNRINFVENTQICREERIYGMYDSEKKLMTICTDRIKKSGNTAYYINETILHESVHYAQSCKSFLGRKIVPFWISKSLMPLSERRKKDMKRSFSNLPKNLEKQVEHEALWMEDKPEKVNYVIRKFCF